MIAATPTMAQPNCEIEIEVLGDEALVDDLAGDHRNQQRGDRGDHQEADCRRDAPAIAHDEGDKPSERAQRLGVDALLGALAAEAGRSLAGRGS